MPFKTITSDIKKINFCYENKQLRDIYGQHIRRFKSTTNYLMK